MESHPTPATTKEPTMNSTVIRSAALLIAAFGIGVGGTMLATGTLPAAPADNGATTVDGIPSDELWPAVHTYQQALAQCHDLSVDDTMLKDCVDAAAIAWPADANPGK